jgi:pimeloyl-ACP methyl ester carboxylesterase
MKTVTSKDGTTIAYEKLGSGPPLLLIDGAFCMRTFGPMPKLAPLLAPHFTVVHYDRRGRGDSTDAAPSAVDVREREIDDVRALVDMLGGEANIYGCSSGAMLALRSVAAGVKATKLALYEAPLSLDGTRFPNPPDWQEQIRAMLARDDRGSAVKLFMKVVGMPSFAITMMSIMMPGVWKQLRGVAHTLPYDFAQLGDTQRGAPVPDELLDVCAKVRVPTIVASGGKSPPYMAHTMKRLAECIGASAKTHVVPKQDHNVSEKAIAPVLLDHFASSASSARAA